MSERRKFFDAEFYRSYGIEKMIEALNEIERGRIEKAKDALKFGISNFRCQCYKECICGERKRFKEEMEKEIYGHSNT